MPDCRFILDNLNDSAAMTGPLVTGSDAVDISGAQMVAGPDGWVITISTVNPAQQNPRLRVFVALDMDVDGRADNNVLTGPQAGADTVYGIVYGGGAWTLNREQMDRGTKIFAEVQTKATYSIDAKGYTLKIPYAEVPQAAPAYWKVNVAERDAARVTIDYVPDAGLSCTPSLAPKNDLPSLAARTKYLLKTGLGDQLLIGAVVLGALIEIFIKLKKIRNKKMLSRRNVIKIIAIAILAVVGAVYWYLA